MIILLALFLIIILFFNLFLNKGDIISPSVLFSFSFVIAVVFASFYKKRWSLDLHLNTFLVILLGVLIFSIVTYLTTNITKVFIKKNSIENEWKPQKIEIEDIKLVLFILFELFTIYFSIHSVVKVVNGSLSNFTEAVSIYRTINLFGDGGLALPVWVTYSRLIVEAAGYWFSYILMNNYYVEKKINKKIFIIIFFSIISGYILGGRNGIIDMIIAIICSYFIISNKASNFKRPIKISLIIKLVVLTLIVLFSFESLAFLIGRSGFESATGVDYLAVYIGAPIKNLDVFLQEPPKLRLPYHTQTFIHLMNWVGPKLNLISGTYKLDLPFRYIDSMALGNVYTTFYAYIYDFGYLGVAILISIMAFLTQFTYEKVKRVMKITVPALSSLMYIYISSAIIMSFFSNKFYEKIFNISFVKMIIIWILLDLFFCKILFRNDRKN